MALRSCSRLDEAYKLVCRDHFEAGMKELVCFTQHLLEREEDPEAHKKIRERIKKASQELSAAEGELGRQLRVVDAATEELVKRKKTMQDEQEEKKETLTRLRAQLDSCLQREREAMERLERAERECREMQAEVRKRQEEAAKNRVQRDVGIGLMFIPFLGTIIGSVLVGCGQIGLDAANKAAGEAQEAANRLRNEVDTYSAEAAGYRRQERNVEAEIEANEHRLAQLNVERQELVVLQRELIAQQDGLRKCTTFVSQLAGRVSVTRRLTKDLVIYEELSNILGEVVQQVLSLTSPEGEAGTRFLATKEIHALAEKLKSDGCSLRALADAEPAATDW